ncbi:Late embryogenesis abundant (LEA) hydroxyproline-rich glycoprotein family [Quillaja saponaria]|uniref:Late embryogenesis abundant (LEA) hydroxyproline-rich glycoprotein family n=1 Tax=Quillaja saponaria TaxID=32244 RepID=A0AAD7PDZ9_QUISA|nr:Late embryogenesis abundant (LEA) hydroxyproline-rich glycoprotein family [Quillaja saponaria]
MMSLLIHCEHPFPSPWLFGSTQIQSLPPRTANGGTNPQLPAAKAQLYGATRPTYRPQSHHRRNRRSRCCSFCFWLILIITILLFLAAIAGAIFYVLYRPHRPSFTVIALKLSYLNISSSSTLNSKFDLNITARNPNKKIKFIYNPITISVFSDDITVGDGTIPGFVHTQKNSTLLKASILSSGQALENGDVSKLKANMKSKNGLPLKVRLDTKVKVKVKIGGVKTKKVGIRINCDGIKVNIPSGKTPATASTSKAKCKVDFRIKIWKWTI